MNLNIVRRDSTGQPFSLTAYVMAPFIPASADQRMPPTFLLSMTVMLSIPLAALGLVGIGVYFWFVRSPRGPPAVETADDARRVTGAVHLSGGGAHVMTRTRSAMSAADLPNS
jgi:hypothetical protein